jgi:flagellar motor switch protein FliM
MTTTHPLSVTAGGHSGGSAQGDGFDDEGLVPSILEDEEEHKASTRLPQPFGRLPVELDVAVPVREFRVRNLLALEAGQVIETDWGHSEDVPLSAGSVQLTWSEFEVVDTQLAVRVTRLA